MREHIHSSKSYQRVNTVSELSVFITSLVFYNYKLMSITTHGPQGFQIVQLPVRFLEIIWLIVTKRLLIEHPLPQENHQIIMNFINSQCFIS